MKRDETIKIVPADKGKVLVVMDRTDYEQKISEHLNDETVYVRLERNPTNDVMKEVNKLL